MTDPVTKRHVAMLVNVLKLENRYGFKNSAVIGGLDGMLGKLGPEADSIRNLPPMSGRRYSAMSESERKVWSAAVLSRLSGGAVEQRQPGPQAATRTQQRATSPNRPAPVRRSQPQNRPPSLRDPIESLRFLHHATRTALKTLGLQTFRDVLWHFPLRHIDYTSRTDINELVAGVETTVEGEVVSAEASRFGGRQGYARVRIRDHTGYLAITWFNMPYMADRWRPGDRIVVSGEVGVYRGNPTMENPEYDDVTRSGRNNSRVMIHAGALVPVYPLSAGVNQRTVRNGIMQCLDRGLHLVDETLPQDALGKHKLMKLADAIDVMHRPMSMGHRQMAYRRLAFDEFLYNQIAAIRRRSRWRNAQSASIVDPDTELVSRFTSSLGFQLTGDQASSLSTILEDIGSAAPMARLLQGEVGSGKTVVAVAAMLSVSGVNGKQSALMAPTEVLAEQHFMSVLSQLQCRSSLGSYGSVHESPLYQVHERNLRVGLLTGSKSPREKRQMQKMCAEGEVDLIVGTHALLQDAVDFKDLALVVLDEQQRFGTEQRAHLTNRTPRPHMLAMSATPIPRTLHMTMYGEMDISTLRAMPHGRKVITTSWAQTPMELREAYATVRREVQNGRQAFVVCPFIEPSEKLEGASALVEHRKLSEGVFSDLNVGLLHGRMSLAEKQSIMEAFRSQQIDVLVATPVIEVGVDVPNATVMIIMSADYFGLSQLHQIRGRVGRGENEGICYLISDAKTEVAQARLNAVLETLDGFKLAQRDLEIRGPGSNLAELQSGWSGWRFARFDDLEMLSLARNVAESLLADDFDLNKPEHLALKREAIRTIGRSVSRFA